MLEFRAWDLTKNKWINSTNKNPFHIIGEHTMFDILNQYHIEEFSDIEVNQYTGLKDANGVDVFEGDILEYRNELGLHRRHKVFRVEGGLVINSHNDDINKDDNPFYEACADMQTAGWIKQCAVVGNIYENKDLLIWKKGK